jgi:hypothetical protein
MSAQRLAFLELKKRLTVLELQHNTLTSICTVLAKQIKDLRSQPTSNNESLNKSEIDMITTNKKSVEQLFKERLQSRGQKTEIREIDLNKNKTNSNIKSAKKKTKKQPIPEPVVEECEESEDESENSSDGDDCSNESSEEEAEPVQVKPLQVKPVQVKPVALVEQKVNSSVKTPAAKTQVKKTPTKRAVKAKNSNIAVEIVDSMST